MLRICLFWMALLSTQKMMAQSKWRLIPFIMGKPFQLIDPEFQKEAPIKCQQLTYPELPICQQLGRGGFQSVTLNLKQSAVQKKKLDIVLWSRFQQKKYRLVPLKSVSSPQLARGQDINLSLKDNHYRCSFVDNKVEEEVLITHWTLRGKYFEKRVTSKEKILQNPYAHRVTCHKILFNGHLFAKVSQTFKVKPQVPQGHIAPTQQDPLPAWSKASPLHPTHSQLLPRLLQIPNSRAKIYLFYLPHPQGKDTTWECSSNHTGLDCQVLRAIKGKGLLIRVFVEFPPLTEGTLSFTPVYAKPVNSPKKRMSRKISVILTTQDANFQSHLPSTARLVLRKDSFACLPQGNDGGVTFRTLWRLGQQAELRLADELSQDVAKKYKSITCYVVHRTQSYFRVATRTFSPQSMNAQLHHMKVPFLLTAKEYPVEITGKFSGRARVNCFLSNDSSRFLALDKNLCRVSKRSPEKLNINIQLSQQDLRELHAYPFGSYELFLPKKLLLHMGVEDKHQALHWKISAQILIPNARPNVLMQQRGTNCEVRVQDPDRNHISGFLHNQTNTFTFATFATQTQPKVRLRHYLGSTVFFFPHDGFGCDAMASDGILYTRDNLNLAPEAKARQMEKSSIFSLKPFHIAKLFQEKYRFKIRFHTGKNHYKQNTLSLNPNLLGFVNASLSVVNPYLNPQVFDILTEDSTTTLDYFQEKERELLKQYLLMNPDP